VLAASGWAESGQARMGAPPWQTSALYRRNSPISYVDRIVAPVMLIYGDLDGDPKQPQELFTSLYRQNKDAVLLIYRGESHVVISPANVRDEYAKALAFLHDNIGPSASP
jgi:dipeptidyl aminopeptidase/acylaminoacyl peptidase